MSLRNLIKPANVKANQHLWSTFGNSETEVSAGWIVRFLQANGNTWESFKLNALQAYYSVRLQKNEDFYFNRLLSEGHVTIQGEGEDRLVIVNDSFIARLASQPNLIEG